MLKQTIFILALVGATLANPVEHKPEAPEAAQTSSKLTEGVMDVAYLVQKNAVRTFDDAKPVLNNIKQDLNERYEKVKSNPDVQKLTKIAGHFANKVATDPYAKEVYEISKPYIQRGKDKASVWLNELSRRASTIQAQMRNGYESRYGTGQQQQQQQTEAEAEEDEREEQRQKE